MWECKGNLASRMQRSCIRRASKRARAIARALRIRRTEDGVPQALDVGRRRGRGLGGLVLGSSY